MYKFKVVCIITVVVIVVDDSGATTGCGPGFSQLCAKKKLKKKNYVTKFAFTDMNTMVYGMRDLPTVFLLREAQCEKRHQKYFA